VDSYQQRFVNVVEHWVIDLPTIETPRVELGQCVEAFNQPDLEMDIEEVGVEDQHPTMIVKFCRKSMGI